MLERRAAAASACPSEVARELAGDDWRRWMAAVRRVAQALALDGSLQITRRGVVLDPAVDLRGAIRLRRPPADHRRP